MKLFHQWIERTFSVKKAANAPPRLTRLNLECLEDRITPSTFTVTDLTDNPSDPGSIRYAINQVNADTSSAADTIDLTGVTGTITLSNGALGLTRTSGSIAITGPGVNALTISGNARSQVFTIAGGASVSISGLTVAQGTAAGNGGGIYNSGTLAVNNCDFNDNTAYRIDQETGDGGGVYNSGSLSVSGCNFSSNSADYITEDGNGDDGGGGGIYDPAGTLIVSGSAFSDNSANGGSGGGIFVQGGTLTVSSSTFIDNRSYGYGGGVSNQGAPLSVSDCTFTDNSTFGVNGGGISSTSALTVRGSVFSNNQSNDGGAIYGGQITVSDSTFDGNSAGYSGAGIYGSQVMLSDSTFDGNSAIDGGGGGLFMDGASTVIDSTFSGDSADSIYGGPANGGAIYNDGALVISGSTFNGNFASVGTDYGYFPSYGGAIFNRGALAISGSTISGNSVSGSGGGIFVASGSVSLLSTIVAGNVTNGSTTPNDITGSLNLAESAYNLIGMGGSGGLTNANNNQIGVSVANAGLESLTPNGGPTNTIALQNGSFALQTGSAVLTTLSAPLTAGLSNTTFTVNDPTFLGVGEVIAVASEQMQITAISGTTVTVMRGYNNTTNGSHLLGANVVLPTDQRGLPRTVFGFTDVGAFQTQAAAPTVTTQPISQSILAGGQVTFTAAASGYPDPTVQWQVNTGSGFANLTDGGAYSGSETTTLTITGAATTMNGYQFQAVFTSGAGSLTTNAATLTVTSLAEWQGFAENPQHTAVSTVASQSLEAIHWQTPIDLDPQFSGSSLLIHYGSPSITVNNTVIVPVKTAANGDFEVEAFNGATGAILWTQTSDYQPLPSSVAPNWTPSYAPALTPEGRYYFAGDGGTVYFINDPNSPGATISGQIAFFGNADYDADPSAYNSTVFINTPITSDGAGNIYFGFVVTGANPLGLQSGIARIAPDGTVTYVSAETAAGNPTSPSVVKLADNSAPALSNDGSTLYIVVNNGYNGISNYGYLVSVNSETLAFESRALLTDPASGDNANIPDDGTASPTIGPDGDVYIGVLENPFPENNYRGWLLQFSGDLSVEKTPAAFGWDDTASIVPASMVPSYQGTSSYLLMIKYNNYAGVGTGNGLNEIAIVDPNSTETYSVPGNSNVQVMAPVLTILGPTADPITDGPYPGSVYEWCINSAVVDPATDSVLAGSEDGILYRWDLATKSFSQSITLTPGLGEAYTPTLIGADGTVYAINDATLFAVGNIETAMTLTDNGPNPSNTSQSITLTVTAGGAAPNGESVTLEDASNNDAVVPATGGTISGGSATLTIAAGTLNSGTYNLFAVYAGDSTYPACTSNLVVQVVDTPSATGTTVTSNPVGPLTQEEPVTFTALIGGSPNVGTVSFYVGSVAPANLIGMAVNVSGGTANSSSDSSLPVGNSTIIAVYSGGVGFAGSVGYLLIMVNATPPTVVSFTVNGSGTAVGGASASENSAGTTATITASGLNLLGFYPGELVNVSGFTNQTGFNGTYTITATSGNTFSYGDSLPGNVTDTSGTATPALEESNAGTLQSTQASMMDSLVVVFNEAVTIASPSTAFSLALKTFTDNGSANSMVGDATTTVTASNPSGDSMTWVLQFSGGTTAPVLGGSISDGDYYLNLAAGSVASAASATTVNASYQNNFYRLYGDINGDGQVTSSAYKTFSKAYGAVSISNPSYNAAFDYDDNGQITSTAYKAFSKRYGLIWTGL